MFGRLDWMLMVLGAGVVFVLVSFWRAHKRPTFDFNAFDLIMENGKVSRLALWYNLAGAVSTWVIVDLQLKDKLTEGMFGLWLGAWVGPIIAKLVFDKKDMPTPGTLTTTKIETTEQTSP